MKTITINVSEQVYSEFQDFAQRHGRPASELIREAMESYRATVIRGRSSIAGVMPLDLGEVLAPLDADDDLLDEMLP
jgi:predicted transcriptional regulator